MSDKRKFVSPGSSDTLSVSTALIEYIQNANEHQRALLARELHDELGGLLVGAVMDLAWAEQHLSAPPGEMQQKLVRARQALASAIDLKRRLIEELRPTLLDNVGLFAALRWHVQAMCKRADVPCNVTLPDEERKFLPNIPIALFRIVQEGCAMLVDRGLVTSADLEVRLTPQSFVITIEGRGSAAAPTDRTSPDAETLAMLEYRTKILGGSFRYLDGGPSKVSVVATFPRASVLATS